MSGTLWRVFEEQTVDGKYALLRLLGVGSYGGVFLADEVVADRLIRQVAVKLMESDPSVRDAQMQELIAAANLDHPGLLRTFTCGLCELNRVPLLYLVTELAEETLEDRVVSGILPPDDARSIAVSVASALHYLHRQQNPLVHRDVKPANVMRVGAEWKLGDFGLLRVSDRKDSRQTGTMVGTAAYAPPESYRGIVTAAWDVWSLGVLLAEALTGCLPFEGDDPHRLMIAVSSQEPRLPPDLTEPFRTLIRGCLAKDETARWTVEQVLDALSDGVTAGQVKAQGGRLPAAFYSSLGEPDAGAPVDGVIVVSAVGGRDFISIGEAIRAAAPGSIIQVLPGEYRESLVLDRQVTIEGLGEPGSIIVEGCGAPCLKMRTHSATVRGITLISRPEVSTGVASSARKHAAVEIGEGELILESCEITGLSTVGVSIHGETARPTLRDCRIHDGKAGGILFADGAQGLLERCEIAANGGTGIEVVGGANPCVRDCAVRDAQEAGIRVEGAGGSFEDVEIVGSGGPGLFITAGATPSVTACRIHGGSETGLSVRDGAQGLFDRCEIWSNVLTNVLITQSANPILRRSRIHDGQSNGIWISEGGNGLIEECEVFGNTFAGIKVSHGGSAVVRRTTLRDGKRCGVAILDRGRATLIDCEIAASAHAGIQAETGGHLTLKGCIVRDGKECGVWMACAGDLEDCDVFGNAGAGIELRQGGKPVLRSCRVHDGGYTGILARSGAEAIISDCDIYSNALAGVAIGEGSRVDVRSCRIFDGKQVGLVCWDHARGVIEDCEIYGNALGGSRILQESDPLIRNCRINRNGCHGIHVSERSEGAVLDCDLAGNQADALFVEAGCSTQAIGNIL